MTRTGDAPRDPRGVVSRVLAAPIIAGVRLYQLTLSPFVGGHCRFRPTCSAYALGALRTLPLPRALWLTLRRLSRCRPLGGGGWDPPPPPDRRGRDDQRAG